MLYNITAQDKWKVFCAAGRLPKLVVPADTIPVAPLIPVPRVLDCLSPSVLSLVLAPTSESRLAAAVPQAATPLIQCL